MEYLYSDGSHHHFMNTETYEQVALTEEELGDAAQWLMAGLKIEVEFYNGTPIGVALPASMELEVVDCEPALRAPRLPIRTSLRRSKTASLCRFPRLSSRASGSRLTPPKLNI